MRIAAYYVGLILALLLIGWASGWHQSDVAKGFVDMWCWREYRYTVGPSYGIGSAAAIVTMIVFAIVVCVAAVYPLATEAEDSTPTEE